EDRKTHTMSFKDADDYIETFVEGTPLGHSIREEDPDVQGKILARTRENLREWRTRNGIRIPCECVIVTARKRSLHGQSDVCQGEGPVLTKALSPCHRLEPPTPTPGRTQDEDRMGKRRE